MTRLKARPLRRAVDARSEKERDFGFDRKEFIVELDDRSLRIRPLRSRAGGPAEVIVLWSQVYLHAMNAKVEEQLRSKRRGRRVR